MSIAVAERRHTKTAQAETDFRRSLETGDPDKSAIYQFALFMLRQDRMPEAKELLDRAATPGGPLGPHIMLGELHSASEESQEHERAVSVLEALSQRFDQECEAEKFDIAHALLKAHIKCNGRERGSYFLEQLVGRLCDVSILSLRAFAAHDSGGIESARSHALAAVQAIAPETPEASSYLLGNLLAAAGEYSAALKALKPITRTQSPDAQIGLTLTCAREAEEFRFILDFCSSLREVGDCGVSYSELDTRRIPIRFPRCWPSNPPA